MQPDPLARLREVSKSIRDPSGDVTIVLENLRVPRFHLSGEPQRLVACGVEAVAEEFLEYRAGIWVCEKFRERVAHRRGGDELERRDTGPDGAQPRAERRPDPARMFHGEVLQDALTDEAHLDMRSRRSSSTRRRRRSSPCPTRRVASTTRMASTSTG